MNTLAYNNIFSFSGIVLFSTTFEFSAFFLVIATDLFSLLIFHQFPTKQIKHHEQRRANQQSSAFARTAMEIWEPCFFRPESRAAVCGGRKRRSALPTAGAPRSAMAGLGARDALRLEAGRLIFLK